MRCKKSEEEKHHEMGHVLFNLGKIICQYNLLSFLIEVNTGTVSSKILTNVLELMYLYYLHLMFSLDYLDTFAYNHLRQKDLSVEVLL